jgi:hypothetical protein
MAAPKGNKFALGNTGGKPPRFETPAELAAKITEYFDYCIKEKEKVTITGLILYCGFCDRQALDGYVDKSEEFALTVKRAKTAVTHSYEMRGNAIDIFILKNMGYTDRQEIDHLNNGNSFNSLTDAELVTRLGRLLEPGKKE